MRSLLAIHSLGNDLSGLKPLTDLAQNNEFHLNVVVLGVLPTIQAMAAPGVVDLYYDESGKQVIADAKDQANEIEKLLQTAGVSGSVTVECRELANVENAILKHAMLQDATLFSQGVIMDEAETGRSFDGALFHSGRPVFIAGEKTGFQGAYSKVVFAWNGEPESARALHNALPWLADGAQVDVSIVDPTEYQFGPNAGDDVANFLARRKLKVGVNRIASAGRDVSQVLREHAIDADADLIVMGAYGRSRFREWLLGGTTRELLEKSEVTILMSK